MLTCVHTHVDSSRYAYEDGHGPFYVCYDVSAVEIVENLIRIGELSLESSTKMNLEGLYYRFYDDD